MLKRGQKVRVVKGSRYVDMRTGGLADGLRGVVVGEWLGKGSQKEYRVKFPGKGTTWIKQGCLEIREW